MSATGNGKRKDARQKLRIFDKAYRAGLEAAAKLADAENWSAINAGTEPEISAANRSHQISRSQTAIGLAAAIRALPTPEPEDKE